MFKQRLGHRWFVSLAMVLVLLASGFSCLKPGQWLSSGLPAWAEEISDLKLKKMSAEKRLKRIRDIKHKIILQERYVTHNIIKNQKRLEATKSSLDQQETALDSAKTDLQRLESDLSVALTQQQKLSIRVGQRLRNFYMGEHLSWLHMLLDARNVSSFMDRFYYQKQIYSRDKALVAEYRQKTQTLEGKKTALAWHKVKLSNTIRSIHGYQSQLQESMHLDQMLVAKLKNSKRAYEMAEDQLQRESISIQNQIQHLTSGAPARVVNSTGRMAAPVVAPIRSGFGYRVHPVYHSRKFHSGLDFGARNGSPIRAADGGTVLSAGWQGGYGKTVIINHGTSGGRNVTTLYGHMSRTAVGAGQSVAKGQVVGYVGSTGLSTGPHLHFEVRENGRPVNPLGYLR